VVDLDVHARITLKWASEDSLGGGGSEVHSVGSEQLL